MGCRGCEGEKNSLRSLRSKWGGYVLDECYPVEHTICISNKQETINSTIPLALVQKAMQSAQTSKENQHQPVPWRGTHFSRTANGLGHRCLHQRTRVRTQTSKENQHQRAPWRGTHSSVVLRMVWVTVVFIFVQINKTKSVGNK